MVRRASGAGLGAVRASPASPRRRRRAPPARATTWWPTPGRKLAARPRTAPTRTAVTPRRRWRAPTGWTQLLRAGTYRPRPDHRHRGVRSLRTPRDVERLHVLLRAVQPRPQRSRGRRPAGRRPPIRRAGPRHRAGRGHRTVGLSRRLRGPQLRQRRDRPSTSSTASPATTRPRSSPRAGATARRTSRRATVGSENAIFSRMVLQGQTMIAASGDSGSEDCLLTDGSTRLAVDDPGSQPNVISGGGTTLPSASASSQVVWNDCQGPPQTPLCSLNLNIGAGGGGLSGHWARPTWQPPLTAPSPTRLHHAVRCRIFPARPTPPTAWRSTSVAGPSSAARASCPPRTPASSLTPTKAVSPNWAALGRRSMPQRAPAAPTSPTSPRATTTSPTPTTRTTPPRPASTPRAASAHPTTRICSRPCRAATARAAPPWRR